MDVSGNSTIRFIETRQSMENRGYSKKEQFIFIPLKENDDRQRRA